MNVNIVKPKYVLLSLLVFFANTFEMSAVPLDSCQKIGDIAKIQVLYKATQKVVKNQSPMDIIDTMVLYSGENMSLYNTWNKIAKNKDYTATQKRIKNKSTSVVTFYDNETFLSKLTDKNNVGNWTINWETEDIYKNRKESNAVFIKNDESEGWIKSIETIPSQRWEIHSDTMTIIGYKCQKATTSFWGRTFEAWFSLDIPQNDGPWLFYGTPGLILKVQDQKGVFEFSAVGLEQLKTDMPIGIDEALSYKTVSLKDYLALKKNRNKYVKYYSWENGVLYIADIENPIEYPSLYPKF